jgi:hypothetical protein
MTNTNYFLQINGHGYLSNSQNGNAIEFTQNKSEAMQFDGEVDNPETKILSWSIAVAVQFGDRTLRFKQTK